MSDVLSAAAAVKRLAERRAQDALHSWVPTARQAPFIECQESEAWFIAANRSGKSDALAAIIASLARFGRTDPRPAYCPSGAVVYDKAVSIWATSLTFPLGRDILQPKLFDNGFVPAGQPHAPFIPPWEIARWTTTDQVLKLKNGSLIGFKSCDQGRDLFQGEGAGRSGQLDRALVQVVRGIDQSKAGGVRRRLRKRGHADRLQRLHHMPVLTGQPRRHRDPESHARRHVRPVIERTAVHDARHVGVDDRILRVMADEREIEGHGASPSREMVRGSQ